MGLRSGSWTGRSPLPTFSQDDERGEEWERHEALHEDVTGQERTTEQLFEEEIELKWEKGGSGLVFYTDAQFWQEEEGGNTGTRARAGVIPAAFAQGAVLHMVGSLAVSPTKGLGKRLTLVVYERPAILSRGEGSVEWRENALLQILNDPPSEERFEDKIKSPKF